MLLVQKFGGTSVANEERIMNVARRVVESYKEKNRMVIVLSAPSGLTDNLINMAKSMSKSPSNREMDQLITIGEQQSIALLAMAIHSLGYPAVSLTAKQAGIHCVGPYGNARVKNIQTGRIQAELDKNNIVVVAGFQAINNFGDICTIGRGGSDITAVALASALHADICEIYTDVDGIYTGDPRIFKNARKLETISYDEMLELASSGAQVLQKRSVEMAKRYHVNLVVRSSLNTAPGTRVKEESHLENMYVAGVAIDKNVARITVEGLPDEVGVAFKLFSLLAKEEVSVDIILQPLSKGDINEVSFTVKREELERTLALLEERKQTLRYKNVSHHEEMAKLTVVGAGMAHNHGVASMMFDALRKVDINMLMISTSEITISVLIAEKDAERGANAVHDMFMGFEL